MFPQKIKVARVELSTEEIIVLLGGRMCGINICSVPNFPNDNRVDAKEVAGTSQLTFFKFRDQ